MRTLALADAPPHAPLPELAESSGAELILVLGDLEPAWADGLERVELPKLGVRGNHDSEGLLSGLGVEEIHLRSVELGGLSFCGFGGSPRYSLHGGNEWTEDEAERLLSELPRADVLLTHSPPAGVNDEPDDRVHRGSPALLAWVEDNRPSWLLHGHTHPHPARVVHQLGDTRIAYVRGALALELD